MRVMRRSLAALALVLVGCGGSGSHPAQQAAAPSAAPAASGSIGPVVTDAPTAADAAPVHATVATCTAGQRRPLTTDRAATVLYVTKPTVARRAPKATARRVVALQPKSVYRTRQVLLALEEQVTRHCQPAWYRVRLPAKPNGITGWVPARGVVSDHTGTRIVVDLSSRHLDLYRLGRRVMRVRTAIGHIETPTPTGKFYVDVRYHLSDPGGPYGPGLLGIAAYSEAEQGWAAGNPIAIHGTNAPSLIGTRASNGCIRVHNADIKRIMKLAPTGTPVEIRA
jgi:lipoprotein-anchoring transpeptidase ErfK/SrfK